MHKDRDSREIRRYANRRLYDATDGRCVTQKELGELVRAGEALRVVDYESGRDITVDVLAQVAHREVASWHDRLAGTELYSEIIIKGGEMGKKTINNVILAGLGALSLTREKAEEIVDTLIKRGEVSRKDRKATIDSLIAKAEDQARKFSDTMKAKAQQLLGVKREEHEALAGEVERLRETVARLEEKLARSD